MNSKTKSVLAVSFAILFISAVYAAILVQKEIPTTMRIKAMVSMEVYDVDAATPLNSVALGDFLWSEIFYYPGKTTTEPTQSYYVNNTDQMDFYVQFDASAIPEQVNMFIRFRRLDQPSWSLCRTPLSGLVVYELPLISRINNPDPNVQAVHWQLMVVINPGAVFDDFTPTLIFRAVDSPSG